MHNCDVLLHQPITVGSVRPSGTATAAGQAAATQAAQVGQMATQVMQSGVPQATIPVQIPISTAGGQTVLQTIPFPVQIPCIPNMVQANGQTLQVVPQLAQVRMLTLSHRCLTPNSSSK